MVERIIDAWCCQCQCLVLRETTMSEITSLGWSEGEEGLLCPNCTYYANRVEGGPVLLPPPDYSVMRPLIWNHEPGHWEGVVKKGKVRYDWVSNTIKPKVFSSLLCKLFGHKARVGVCPRCGEDIKLTIRVKSEVSPEPPFPFGIPTRDRRKDRYETARDSDGAITLYMTSDLNQIFGPDGLHLVRQLGSEWMSVADEDDIEEERQKFLATDFSTPLRNISSDPRIKEHLEKVSTKLMQDDPHLPGDTA